MSEYLLDRFERAIRQRIPAVADSLHPGLPADSIRTMLHAADVVGQVELIVSFFGWKNGCHFDPGVTLGEASPFPESVHGFADLQTMIEHFAMFHETFVYHPQFQEAHGRYFPLFWDSATGYLAVDLRSPNGRVVILDPETDDLAREAYVSFEEFLQDAIQANEENRALKCFEL